MTGGPPLIEILIFAVLAIFLIFRLHSVLGRRDGFDGWSRYNKESASRRELPLEQIAEASGQGIEAITMADSQFDARAFLDGACQAYRMILQAFARNDTETLKPLLGYDMAASFNDAIRDRRKEGEELSITLHELDEAEIIDARLNEGLATIKVELHSRQTRILKNEAGDIIDGEPDRVESFVDRWTFERDIASENPNWLLVETETVSDEAE